MSNGNKYNLEAWKRYGGKKQKGRWSFGIDDKKYDVKGVWKRDKSGSVTFKPSLFGNKSMRERFGESPRKTFRTIEKNKKEVERSPVEPAMPVRYDDLGPEGKKLWNELRK
mgnify:CR=1 FL=1